MSTVGELIERLDSLTQESLDELGRFVEYLHWKQGSVAARSPGHPWTFDFVENLHRAQVSADIDPAGMEVRVGEAVCSGELRMALWQHPPVRGSAIVEFQVPVPADVHDLHLCFTTGIRDGSQLGAEHLVAFRIVVDSWKVWSDTQQAREWKEHEVSVPTLPGDVARIQFITDGLGNHEWAWAAWGQPRLTGEVLE